ncbi:phosphatase PAP2-related protein [Flectobacillus major]|jgi:hypothetical protein|uniref:phosphatase PAP2-related protein n=1 Tax=Flectobacillus major TaxID=103 RepID=UPI00041B929A|nr:phosphatase PAP2-related protein [Flectobacillus major]
MYNNLLTRPSETKPQKVQENYSQTLKNSWKREWQSNDFRIKFLLVVSIFIIGSSQLASYLNNIQKRPGVVLNDIVLNVLPPVDASIPIFTLLYGMLIYMIIKTIKDAPLFLLLFTTFVIETIFRMTTIALVPLDAPVGLINLTDPLTQAVVYVSNQPITKDLFFSGHTATLVMVWIFLQDKRDKILGGITCILLAFLLLLQHVHYTADVLAAFAFTVSAYQLAKILVQLKWPFTVLILLGFLALLLSICTYAATFAH